MVSCCHGGTCRKASSASEVSGEHRATGRVSPDPPSQWLAADTSLTPHPAAAPSHFSKAPQLDGHKMTLHKSCNVSSFARIPHVLWQRVTLTSFTEVWVALKGWDKEEVFPGGRASGSQADGHRKADSHLRLLEEALDPRAPQGQ